MRQTIKSAAKFHRIACRSIPLASNLMNFRQEPTHQLINKPIFWSGTSVDVHKNISKSSYEGPGFYMEQLFTGCLAIYSYYIESGGEAFLIDPMNEIEKYAGIINARKSKLKGVFLSHYHADYIAGHMELTKKYDCPVIMGPNALKVSCVQVAQDNQEFKLGSIKLRLIHTPGHTE